MLLTVCIEAGRTTLTYTSWTEPPFGSRKWMSGQAAALAALNDRWPLANLSVSSSLRDSTPPSARRPPSPLDFYLSWMSPIRPICRPSDFSNTLRHGGAGLTLITRQMIAD
jgi:hypothetical protein